MSSFGIGGTNVHLLLESAPPRPRAREDVQAQTNTNTDVAVAVDVLLPLSANSAEAARAVAAEFHAAALGARVKGNIADALYTVAAARPVLQWHAPLLVGEQLAAQHAALHSATVTPILCCLLWPEMAASAVCVKEQPGTPAVAR